MERGCREAQDDDTEDGDDDDEDVDRGAAAGATAASGATFVEEASRWDHDSITVGTVGSMVARTICHQRCCMLLVCMPHLAT